MMKMWLNIGFVAAFHPIVLSTEATAVYREAEEVHIRCGVNTGVTTTQVHWRHPEGWLIEDISDTGSRLVHWWHLEA